MNAGRHRAPNTSLGSSFQCLTTLIVNKFLMYRSPLDSLVPFLHVISWVFMERRLAPLHTEYEVNRGYVDVATGRHTASFP